MELILAVAKDHGSVFHGTSFINAASIIDNDRIQLSQVAGKQAEGAYAKQPFFFSVRRNRVLTSQNFYDVTIEFKEQALQSRMKRESVDYWGHVEGKGNSIEQEDRYYYAKPVLTRAKRLIRALHIDLSNYDPQRRGSMIRAMIRDALVSKIKVYLYRDKNAYGNLNIRKTVPLSSMEYGAKAVNIFRTRTPEEAEREGEDQMFKGMRYARSKYPDIKFFVDLLYGNTPPVTDKTKYLKERFGYRYGEHDLLSQFQNELHNASHSHAPKEKQLAARLQTWMRDNKKDVRETAYEIRNRIKQLDGEA